MQGFSVAILKSPAEMKIENVQIGPNMLLHLPYDPAANIDCDFAFASPSADIAGSLQFLETLLTSFLSSNGIDPKTVTVNGEGQTYTSGVERLLAMIEKVSASKEDYDTFEKIEQKLWELVSAWLVNLGNSETLEQKYQISNIPESSKCVIEYAKPELVKSDMEELDVIQREIDLGISSPVKAIMEREKLSREDALEKYFQYQAESLGLNGTETIGE
jgi:hypothetical protein